jgi:hypothetical protein
MTDFTTKDEYLIVLQELSDLLFQQAKTANSISSMQTYLMNAKNLETTKRHIEKLALTI